jgi:hypothetical protein
MSATNTIQERNEALASQINGEALVDPKSPYAGRFIGIVRGQVAVVADDLDELGRRLDAIAADPAETFCIHAGRDYTRIEEIWESN